MQIKEIVKKKIIGKSIADNLLFKKYKKNWFGDKSVNIVQRILFAIAFIRYRIKVKYSKTIKCKHISILISAPNLEENDGKKWGDYFYARSLGNELQKYGFTYSIIPMEDWYSDVNNGEYAIYVMGLHGYRPDNRQKNFLWMLYPCIEDKYDNDYELYRHIFIASPHYEKIMKKKYGDKVSLLFQAFDNNYNVEPKYREFKHEILFVGNTRGEFRKSLRYTSINDIKVDVIGKGWERYISSDQIKAEYIENSQLIKEYNESKIVLNDHFQLMRRLGFFNNRIFDVLAAKTLLITDYLPEIENQLFSECICYYKTKEELYDLIEKIKNDDNFRRKKISKIDSILECYSMESSVKTIIKYI